MQLQLDFQPGLTAEYETLLACVRTVVYRNDKPAKEIAADMDLSQSDLSRKLSGNAGDKRRLSVDEMVRICEITADLTPVHWLIEKFHMSDKQRQQRAATEFMKQLPHAIALLRQMGVKA